MAKMGRPTEYSEEVNQAAKDYLLQYNTEHDQMVPSVVGMAVALNLSKTTLYDWANDGIGDFADTLAQCNNIQHVKLLNGGLSNTFNAAITKLMMSNHGYSEKSAMELTGADGGPVEVEHSTFEFVPVGSDV